MADVLRLHRVAGPGAALVCVLSGLLVVPQPASALTGGPDAYGERFADSAAPTGPAYSFVDIVASGTPIGGMGDDTLSAVTMPFTFNWYGYSTTSLQVGSNGFVCFKSSECASACCSPTAIPNTAFPNYFLVAYWTDLLCSAACGYYQTTGTAPNRIFIIEIQNIGYFSGAGTSTWEYKLFETTNVAEVHYQSTSDVSSHCVEAGSEGSGGASPAPGYGLIYSNSCTASAHTWSSLAVRYSNNSPPTAAADACGTLEDTATTVASCNVLANDSDPDGDVLTVTAVGPVSPPALGTASIAPGGAGIIFTPSADQNGNTVVPVGSPATFTYTANDGKGGTSTATVTVSVAPVNDAPVFTPGTTIEFLENYPFIQVPGWATGVAPGPATATDETGQSITWPAGLVTHSNPGLFSGAGGTMPSLDRATTSTSTAPSPATGTFGFVGFKPATDQSGTDNVCFVAQDSGPSAPPHVNTGAPGCVDFVIDPCGPGYPPIGFDQDVTTLEDTPIDIVLKAKGGDCSMLNIVPSSLATAKGALSLLVPMSPTNPFPTYHYVPNPNANGLDPFTFTAADASTTGAPATVTIHITPVDDAPQVADDSYVAFSYWTLNVPTAKGVLANDLEVDGQGLSATLLVAPVHILAPTDFALAADGSFTYKPTPGYAGPDQFTYRASDGLLTADAVASILVVVNAPPVAAFVASANPAQESEAVTFIDQSYDPDGIIVSHAWEFGDGFTDTVKDPIHSFATSGSYPVHLTVVDDVGNVSSVTHIIEIKTPAPAGTAVGPAESSGQAAPVSYAGEDLTVLEDEQVQLQGSGQGSGPLRYAWRQESGPAVVLSDRNSPTPTFTAPHLGTDGPDTPLGFSLRVFDTMESVPSHVTVTVRARNHSPVADAGAAVTVTKGGSVQLDASKSSDPDGDPLSFTWTQASGTAVALSSADTAQPRFDVPEDLPDGTLSFRVSVSDGTVTTASTVLVFLLPAGSDGLHIGFRASDLGHGDVLFEALMVLPEGLSYDWDFGDGGSGAGASVRHHYDAPGTYDVTLRAGSAGATAAAYVHPVTVRDASASASAPEAAGTAWWPWAAGGAALLLAAVLVTVLAVRRSRRRRASR